MNNNIYTIEQFIDSDLHRSFSPTTQNLLESLIQRLKDYNLDFLIVKRNEPVIVFKVAAMYFDKPTSQCNIVTIRIRKNDCLEIEPYESYDRSCFTFCSSLPSDDIIINKIVNIYQRKIEKFQSTKTNMRRTSHEY